MNDKYKAGTKVVCNDVNGVVVANYKFKGDICIDWETGQNSSYDVEWLDENVEVLGDE